MRARWLSPLVFSLLASAAFGAQDQSKVYRVALLVGGESASIHPQIRGLRDGLEEAGYIEGKNLTFDLLPAEDTHKLRAQLKGLVQRKIDAIVSASGAETAVARDVTTEIPIIFMRAGDPVRSGFVKSLVSPTTNLTGLTFLTDPKEIGKQLEVFKEVVPSLRRVIVFIDGQKENPIRTMGVEEVRKVAGHLAIKLTEKSIGSAAEAAQALSSYSQASGVFLICGGVFKEMKKIASLAIRNKMPLFGCSATEVVEEGALLTYAPDLYHIGYRGAWYVDRILKGARPQNLPVETPIKFELVLNQRTAKEIGIRIPPEILLRADKVIQ